MTNEYCVYQILELYDFVTITKISVDFYPLQLTLKNLNTFLPDIVIINLMKHR